MKHKVWSALDPDETKKAFKTLKAFNYTDDEIQNYPNLFQLSEGTLRNRHGILKEAGADKLSLYILSRYLNICHKQITVLKAHRLFPEDTDVIKNIFESFQLEPSLPLKENQLFEEIRREVLNEYLRKVIGFSDDDIKRLWQSYPSRAKHKSAASILKIVDMLKNDLGFNEERIKKNPFVIYADPVGLKLFLTNFQKVAGSDIRELLLRRPKLINSNPELIQKTLNVLEKFNIPPEALGNCPEILTLGAKTIEQRLISMKTIKEFDGLSDHPRILKLVFYQMKAKARLQYLQQLKFRNASLNVLASGSEVFERYTREGADKTKGSDTVNFLVKNLNRTDEEIREYLGRNANWKSIPLTTVKENFDMLTRQELFSPNMIYYNVHLLIYPPERVAEMLERVRTNPEFTKAGPSQVLGLVLYHLELEYHFTGDAVWVDPTEANMVRSLDVTDLPPPTPHLIGFGGRRVKKEIQP